MSLLTDQEIDEIRMKCADDFAASVRNGTQPYTLARAIEAAVIARLATVSVEPVVWLRKTKNSRPDDIAVIDIRKEEADEWKSQFTPGFAWSEPMYPPEALAAARVQALEDAAEHMEKQHTWITNVVASQAIRALIGGSK